MKRCAKDEFDELNVKRKAGHDGARLEMLVRSSAGTEVLWRWTSALLFIKSFSLKKQWCLILGEVVGVTGTLVMAGSVASC